MKDYTKRSNISRSKLHRQDLIELSELLLDGLNSHREPTFQVKTYSDELRIEEKSMDDFFKHKLPDKLDNISYLVHGWNSNGDIEKSLYVDLSDYSTSSRISINGHDQAWVLGKHEQLANFFKGKRVRFYFFNTIFSNILQGAISPIILGIFAYMGIVIFKEGISKVHPILPWLTFILILLEFRLARLKHIVISIDEKETFLDRHRENINLALTIISLIAVIVFGILELKN